MGDDINKPLNGLFARKTPQKPTLTCEEGAGVPA